MDKLNRKKQRKYSIQFSLKLKKIYPKLGEIYRKFFCTSFSNILRRMHWLRTQEFLVFYVKIIFLI